MATRGIISWGNVLFDIYTSSREYPGWPLIYEMVEDDDRQYFMMLEVLYEKGKIKTERYEKNT